ncbi:MAG: hypothetical protein ABFS86_08295 [Planctomycetota bacterium]
MKRVAVALLCLLAVAACKTQGDRMDPADRLPMEGDLAPLPVYPLTRGDWDTSARCAVYPVFQAEQHPLSVGFILAMHRGLRKAGYGTVSLPGKGYMRLDRLRAVDRILRPSRFTFRQTILADRRIAIDAHLLVELWTPGGIGEKRLFEVWARDIAEGTEYTTFDVLHGKLVKNLLNLDSLRGALELEPSRPEEAGAE